MNKERPPLHSSSEQKLFLFPLLLFQLTLRHKVAKTSHYYQNQSKIGFLNGNRRLCTPHSRLTSTKRFTNLKASRTLCRCKNAASSYEFEYFYQCIMTFWGLSDSKRPILMQHQAHLDQNFNDIDPERRFVNLFGESSPLCATASLLIHK